MKKIDFIKEFAEKAGLTQKDTREVLKVLQDVCYSHLKDEDGVQIFDGLKLTAVHKDAKTARNPKTGETINVPAKWSPRAKFGKAAKEAANL